MSFLPESFTAAYVTTDAACTHGHLDCSTREGGPCSDEQRVVAKTGPRARCEDCGRGWGGYTSCPNCGGIVSDPEPLVANIECDGCNGDGVYYGAGSVVNGVFKGFTGTCFRCGGKGHQTPADVKRNTYYDNRVRRIGA